MIIHSKKYLPEPSGVWLFDHDTGELEYLDTHKISSVYTEWPIMDKHETLHIAHGVDSLLNAAASGKKDKLDRSLRARWAGDKLGLLVDTPMQSDFWYRHVASFGSLGAQRRMFLGSGTEGSQLGFVVDDSNDETSVSGWDAGAFNINGGAGNGPGRAIKFGQNAGGGGGGYSEVGENGRRVGGLLITNGGGIIPPEWSYAAIFMNSFTRSNLAMGGSGSVSTSSIAGGDSGNGIVRISIDNITESTNRSVVGSDGISSSYSGGAGSGGLYLALVSGSYELSNNITIDCDGGSGGDGSGGDGGDGGDGRVILLFGNSATITGTISNAETTKKQMLPGLPRGGSLHY